MRKIVGAHFRTTKTLSEPLCAPLSSFSFVMFSIAARARITGGMSFDDLAKPPFSRYRWGIRQSGAYLPESLADALETLWEERLRPEPRKRKS